MIQNNSNLVRGYSKAIFAIANEFSAKEQFLLLLEFLNKAIKDSRVKKFLNNSAIPYTNKVDFLLGIINSNPDFARSTNQSQGSAIQEQHHDLEQRKEINFITLLAKKKHLLLIPNIYEQYDKIYLQNANKLHVTIVSAVFLEDAQKQLLHRNLTKDFDKEVILTYAIERSLIAGLLIKYNDEVIDYSLKGKLLKLHNLLKHD